MKITHVIRGEDHISNTPKQILIYKALGYTAPEFSHLPMILGPDKRRLSKRHGATGVQEYRDKGYFPDALNNYLALLGWNPDTEKEIFSLQELVDTFELNQVQKKPAVFDEKKLHWISGQHIFNSSAQSIFDGIRKINPDWRKNEREEYILNVIKLVKLRAKSLDEFQKISVYFFEDPETYDEKASRKNWKDESINQYIKSFVKELQNMNDWNGERVEEILRNIAEQENISPGKLIHPVRLSLSGISGGPSLFAMMELLGKDTCIRRLEKALTVFPMTKIDTE